MTDFEKALTALREKKPLIHCITNYVTAVDVANMLLASGASPIMADDPIEAAEITAHADALMLNMGTLSENRLAAMLKAGSAANRRDIPVVLDPVGVHLSEFRKTAMRKILSEVKISVIRGNISELLFMGGIPVQSHGVDSVREYDENLKLSAAADVAKMYDCVCAVTGMEDIITDGYRAERLLNGTDKLKKVTGTGDMTTAAIAAFSTVTDKFSAAVFGMAFIGICGEKAEEFSTVNGKLGFKGMGSFRSGLFDAAGADSSEFSTKIRREA